MLYVQLVSQALRFISTAIRSGYYKQLFASKETISGLVQGVVVPNVGLRGAFTITDTTRHELTDASQSTRSSSSKTTRSSTSGSTSQCPHSAARA